MIWWFRIVILMRAKRVMFAEVINKSRSNTKSQFCSFFYRNLLGWNANRLDQIHLVIRRYCLLVICRWLLLSNRCTSTSTDRCSGATNVQFTIVSIDTLLKKISYFSILDFLKEIKSYRQWSSFLFLRRCQTDSVTDHDGVFVAKVLLYAFSSSRAFRHDLA